MTTTYTITYEVDENTPLVADNLTILTDPPSFRLYADGEPSSTHEDNAAFTLTPQGLLSFKAGGADYEKPTDSGGDNVYMVSLAQGLDPITPSDIYYVTVIVRDVPGETIIGTKRDDVVGTGSTVLGQPHPTGEDDTVRGLKGRDNLDGLGGNDWIEGGRHKDTLTGGLGEDCFVFAEKPKKKHADKITDFAVGEDKIYLDGDVFKKLKNAGDGMLKNGSFRDGGPKNGKDRVVYDKDKVFYDKDGDGPKDMKLVVKLSKGLELSADDIIVM